MAQNLVSLRKRAVTQNAPLRPVVTIVDKFFSLAVLSGLVGLLWLGVHLWLMLHGNAEISPRYFALRELHASVQYYLFIGYFVIGFLFHAFPLVLGTGIRPSPLLLGTALLPIAGVALSWFSPESALPAWLIAVPYAAVAGFVLRVGLHAAAVDLFRIAAPVVWGLLAFAAAPFLNLGDPFWGLVLFWCGLMPIIFGTAQQFISGFFGGRRLPLAWATSIFVVYVLSTTALLTSRLMPATTPWSFQAFLALALLTLCLFGAGTQLAARLISPTQPVSLTLRLAFGFTSAWLLSGFALLTVSHHYLDYALHAWTTGAAITLIIATSSQIIGYLSGAPVLGSVSGPTLLLLWQIVPFGRALPMIVGPSFSWIVGVAASIVYLWWGMRIVLRSVQLTRRQMQR